MIVLSYLIIYVVLVLIYLPIYGSVNKTKM